MGKSIEATIADRIDDGMNSWRAYLRLAKASEFPEVRELAVEADTKLTRAAEYRQEVKKLEDKLLADSRKLGTEQDPRQDEMDLGKGGDGDGGVPVE